MTVVTNEVKQAEYILEHGEVGRKPTHTLFLLGKYYRQKKQYTKAQTVQRLHLFMQQHDKTYNSALWENTLEDIAKKATRYPLHEVDSVGITQSELDRIASIKNLKYEKLLFSMLCYAKLYNLISERNNSWVNTDIPELYRTAKITVKHREDKFIYLNDIEQTGLISFSKKNDNLNLRVNFADMTGIPAVCISDFRSLGYEYLNYRGEGTFIRCTHCGCLVRKNSRKDFSTKYCKECAAIVKGAQKYVWDRENRKIRKS